MNVPSFEFVLFSVIAALVFRVSRNGVWRLWALAAANALFFLTQSHGLLSLAPYAGFLALGYGFIAWSQRAPDHRKLTTPVFIGLTLLGFVWLKKYAFFPPQVLISQPYVLIGLSYVFFRVLHLVIDSGAGVIEGRIGPVTYFSYAMNFTSLVSGPIQRFQDYQPQQASPRDVRLADVGEILERIARGLFKVFVLSSLLRQIQAHEIAAMPHVVGYWPHILNGCAIAATYPFFLYCNFSGYTDVVIACARCFGFVLPENFRNPFWSDNFINFWGRWHITLSNWLKTYVYNTLLMRLMSRFPSRGLEPYFAVLAFFVTFFLVGVWHGQTSEFVAFGVLQGGGVAANKLYQIAAVKMLGKKGYKALCARRAYTVLTRGMTFAWFALTLFWFWGSWHDIGNFAARFSVADVGVIMAATIIAFGLIFEYINLIYGFFSELKVNEVCIFKTKYVRTAYASLITVATIGMIFLNNSPTPDIVYKNF